MLFKLALKQILFNKKYHLFFIFNLTLGLWGLLSLNIFSETLERELDGKSKTLLGADISIGARRLFTEDEIKNFDNSLPFIDKTTTIRLFTMARGGDIAKLVRLKGIEEKYPLIGKLDLKESLNQNPRLGDKNIWVYPELAYQFGLNLGDKLLIDNQEFTINAIIERDSSDASNGFSLAPRAYISLTDLRGTGLVTPYSTLREKHLYQISKDSTPEQIAEIERKLESSIKDNTVRVTTPKEASDNVRRALERISDFLGLVTIVSLFLSMVGINYLFKSHIQNKRKDFALYHVMGISKGQASSIFLIEIFLLSLISTMLALSISFVSLPIIKDLVRNYTDLQITGNVRLTDFVIPFIIGLFGSVLSCLPSLIEMRKIKLLELFGNSPNEVSGFSYFLGFLPLLFFFYGLSIYQSRSYIVGSAFIGTLILALILCLALGKIIFWILKKDSFKFSSTSFAKRNIVRNQFGSLSIFISIALGTLLINFIPQVKSSIQQELDGPERSKLPSLFLFDIQSHQIDQLKTVVKKHGNELKDISPLVRARLLKHNGEKYERAQTDDQQFSTQESEQRERFRNRGLNLTFPFERESVHKIVKGRPFSGNYNWTEDASAPAEVSIEKRYAQRLGLNVGDLLTLDIQGVELEAKIINTRSVDWLTFRPNFFVEMQPGSIDEAPKSFIAVLYEKSKEIQRNLQVALARSLPSVSVVDLGQVIKEILRLTDNMQVVLSSLALFSFIIGLFILYTVSNYEAQKYRKEVNLLKVLGAPFGFVQKSLIYQFLYISIFASLLGILFSILIGYGFSYFIFENEYVFESQTILISLLGINLFSLITCYLSTRKVLKSSPASLFQ